MKKEELEKIVLIERDKIASKTFEELSKIEAPIAYQCGNIKDKNFYQVEVEILEKDGDHIHVAVIIDDGGLWRALSPISTGFIMYKDGRVEK